MKVEYFQCFFFWYYLVKVLFYVFDCLCYLWVNIFCWCFEVVICLEVGLFCVVVICVQFSELVWMECVIG